MDSAILTPADVARRWQCSPCHVRRLCRTRALAAMRLGSDWRISSAAVEAYERAHTTEPADVSKPVPPPVPSVAVGGLPDDYQPVFPELWLR